MTINKIGDNFSGDGKKSSIKSRSFREIFISARKLYKEFDLMIRKLQLSKKEIEENKEKILGSIASFEKNNENSRSIIFYLERSDASGRMELVGYEDLLREEIKENRTSYPFLVDIDKKGWQASLSTDIEMNPERQRLLKFMQNLLSKKTDVTFFALLGPTGSGKSYLCSYLAHHINKTRGKRSVAYVNWNKFITSWQQTFGSTSAEMIAKNEESSALYNQLFSIPFLFLDDFGLSKMNEWSRDKLWTNLMTEREKSNLITGVISPLSKLDLSRSFWVGNDIQGRREKAQSFLQGATYIYLKNKHNNGKEK